MKSFDVLIDSDAWIGWMYPDDPHFERSNALFKHMEQSRLFFVTTTMVVDEVATVLSHRKGMALARSFLDILEQRQLPVIALDAPLRRATYTLFRAQTRRGTSVTDCANVAVMQQFAIPQIFAFDQVYTHVFNLDNIANHNEPQAA